MKKTQWFLVLCLFSFISIFVPDTGITGDDAIRPGVFKPDMPTFKINPPDVVDHAIVETVTEWYEAVGTVRPRTESSIESQVTEQIIDVKVRPGDKVIKDQVLVVLDNRKFLSRLDQAKQALKSAIAGEKQARQTVIAAEAAFRQAESDYKRIQTYFKAQAATSKDLEQANSAYLQAKARLERAREAISGAKAQIRQAEEVVKEAEIALGYTTIKAPESGEVLKRLVEPGDLALPGKPLIMLQTAGLLRLEAYVREGLISRVSLGTRLQVSLTSLNKTLDAIVEEIIPYADPETRTFLVKVTIPPSPGVFPGMFGKLLIPVEQKKVVLVARDAVRRVGQLELILIREKDTWNRYFIKTGKIYGQKIEVLAGLKGDETIGYNLAADNGSDQ